MTNRLQGLYIITPSLFSNNESSREESSNNESSSKNTFDSQQLNNYLDKIEAALKSGACVVQFRDKSVNGALRISLARALIELCQSYHALFIINDDVELAAKIGAQGVHLGKDDTSVSLARERLGKQAIIGVSCYNQISLARKAKAQGADYIAFGRFFPSRTKPNAVQADIGLLIQAKKELHLSVAAIGGIDQENAHQLIKAGADLLAVVGGVLDQADISLAAKAIVNCFKKPK